MRQSSKRIMKDAIKNNNEKTGERSKHVSLCMETNQGVYVKYLKRIFDFVFAFISLIILSPLLLGLAIAGSIIMRGNPFFIQKRPGKAEKNFNLIKFRTMSNKKDKNGEFLPDELRLTGYGKFLRKTSLDELPELVNIIAGDCSIVGPRPLIPEYIPYYTEVEHHRHDVRPGLTGLAQVNGRSFISWEEIFAYDLQYIKNITFTTDIKIILETVRKVLGRKNVADVSLARKDKEGQLHYDENGRDIVLHQPLNIERSAVYNAEGNRK